MSISHDELIVPLPRPKRWQAALALIAIGAAYAVLPQRLRIGPPWLLLAIVALLLVPLFFAHVRGLHELAGHFAIASVVVASAAVVVNALLLVFRLPGSKTSGTDLLRDSAMIWFGNLLVFALWYWELDGGGPRRRHPGHYQSADFVFPQFQQDPEHAAERWLPDFVDYLFLAFNTSTAFSPTDTLVLSRRAKLLCMAQSLISLITIGMLAARAINTL